MINAIIIKTTVKTIQQTPPAGQVKIITIKAITQKNPALFTRYKLNIVKTIIVIPASATVLITIQTKQQIKSIPITKVVPYIKIAMAIAKIPTLAVMNIHGAFGQHIQEKQILKQR